MTSSSSSAADIPPPQKKYDVFLSFRGEDTRDTFTSYLHAALVRKKLETYIDYKLERGHEIGPALLEAIAKSNLSVIIFSKNYASSTWCLDELAHILGCKERDGQFVIPIFYDIDPCDVRKQQGSFADAFAKLEERFKDHMDKVLKWRDNLTKAANLSGFANSSKTGTEADFVEKVVQDILTKLNCKWSSDFKSLVGIESQIERIEELLCIDSPDICAVGIWGMGGIGKTTLADAVFYRLKYKFESSCFLANVREHSEEKGGLISLRNNLLCQILKDKDLPIDDTPSIGSDLVKKRLLSTKALIVLDDVKDSRQLELLHGDDVRFGPGSRIIITTRDRRSLIGKVADDKMYEVKGLKYDEALQLFHSHAFKNKSPTTVYTEFSREVVDYVKGIPLGVKILGRLFLPCNTKEDWEEGLKKLKKFPNEEIQDVLMLAYNGLEEKEKEIFLDIACFYKGEARDYVEKMLAIQGFCVDGIRDLVDKSLISISAGDCLEMHDLLQEMGRKIVREQCMDEPGKRNRLWYAEDVHHVLEKNTGTASVQCISFSTSNIKRLHLSGSAFNNMHSLRSLKIYDPNTLSFYDSNPIYMKYLFHRAHLYLQNSKNFDLESLPDALRFLHWEFYPLKTLPSKFSAQNLVELRMPHSQVRKKLWNQHQNLGNLKVIDLRHSKCLTQVPDLSRSPKIEYINLKGCTYLVQIPCYFKDLDKLAYLNLDGCLSLKHLPEMPANLVVLKLYRTAIKELPTSSIKYLFGLERLDLSSCSKFEYLPEVLEPMEHLKSLSLGGTRLTELPSSLVPSLIGLQDLDLSSSRIQELPDDLSCLTSLRKLNLEFCHISELPDVLGCLPSLRDLNLSYSRIKSIPASIKQASQLVRLCLKGCTRLESIPELPPLLQYLQARDCTSLKTVSRSRTALTQGWDKPEMFRGLFDFSNCMKLDYDARNNIMSDAELRIMRMATESSNYFRNAQEINYMPRGELDSSFSSIAVFPGHEIPNWFRHQSEGCSINIKLPPNWFCTDFRGFALSLVVIAEPESFSFGLTITCKCNFKSENGESREIKYPFHVSIMPFDVSITGVLEHPFLYKSPRVIEWYSYNPFELEEGADLTCSTAFYKFVTEASLHFDLFNVFKESLPELKVKKCGIRLLYAQDAEHVGAEE